MQIDTPQAPRQQVRTGSSLCHTEEGETRREAQSTGSQWPGFLDGFKGTGDGGFGEWRQAEGGTAARAVPLTVGCYRKTQGELCGQAELSPWGWRLRQAAGCTPQVSPSLLVPFRKMGAAPSARVRGPAPPPSELPSGHAALALGPLGALGRALSLGGRGRAALPWAPPVVPVPGSKSQGFQPAVAWGRGREALKLLHQGLCLRPGVSRRLLGSADVLRGGLGMNPRHGGMRSVVLLGKEARVSDRPVTAPGIPGRSTRLPSFSGWGRGFLS